MDQHGVCKFANLQSHRSNFPALSILVLFVFWCFVVFSQAAGRRTNILRKTESGYQTSCLEGTKHNDGRVDGAKQCN